MPLCQQNDPLAHIATLWLLKKIAYKFSVRERSVRIGTSDNPLRHEADEYRATYNCSIGNVRFAKGKSQEFCVPVRASGAERLATLAGWSRVLTFSAEGCWLIHKLIYQQK